MEWQGKEEDGRGKNKDKNLKSKDERFGFLCQYVFFLVMIALNSAS